MARGALGGADLPGEARTGHDSLTPNQSIKNKCCGSCRKGNPLRPRHSQGTRSVTLCGLVAFVWIGLPGTSEVSLGQTFEVVTSFAQAPNGLSPSAGLIQASDGSFYGTTTDGGTRSCCGTVFRVNAAGTLTTFQSFTGRVGAGPNGLIQASDRRFFGTARHGGAIGYGTVFKMDAAGTLTTLHSFTGSDGAFPSAGLIQASDGSFYGTTSAERGASNEGTVFKIDAAGTLRTVHSFTGSDGSIPNSLIQTSDGRSFYGTT